MAISRQIQAAISKGDYAAIEDEWLSKSSENPEDLDYFVGVARALGGQDQRDRARFLLEVLDEELKERKLWSRRLKLLERAGELQHAPDTLHKAIVQTLTALHGKHSGFAMLSEKVGLHRAPTQIAKIWEKVERLRNLMSFDVGTVVLMEGKGAGRIVDINLALDSFKIDFEKLQGLMVGFRAAAKLLIPLTEGHVLYRKLTEPEVLKRIAKEDPSELLRLVLESYDGPRTGGEIRADLNGIVSDGKWASWWATARKHPQVVSSTKGRQAYEWAASTDDASEVLWKQFEAAGDEEKLDLFRKAAQRDEDLRRRMAEHLEFLGAESIEPAPALALQIWFTLDRMGVAPESAAWSPPAILAEAPEPPKLLEGVSDRTMREQTYLLIREIREDWQGLFLRFLDQEQDPRGLDVLAGILSEAAPQDWEGALEQILSQPRRRPAAFVWMAERAAEEEALLSRSPLRLLKQLLSSLQDQAFAPFRASRLVPLFESGGTVPRLLDHLSEDQAEAAVTAIDRAAALEPYQRDALRTALQVRFTSLGKEEQAVGLYATHASIEAKKKEFNQLKSVDIPANRKAIQEAREMGDLRENFEYKAARQRHEYLNARIAALSQELSRVQPIDFASIDCKEARVGTRVDLQSDGTRRTLTILGPWESKPEEDVISYESDLAKGLLGKAVGETVDVAGTSFTITAISSAEK
ncbi:MAG: GreA/GreB family elongation factor [Acidobacteria bacterium]|nr:GreA/GreB family elongation factor [Acidobacteriota bacterium]